MLKLESEEYLNVEIDLHVCGQIYTWEDGTLERVNFCLWEFKHGTHDQ